MEDERSAIKSVNYRDLDDIVLYLHGNVDVDNDQLHLVAHAFENTKEAKDAIERFKNLITEFNSRRGNSAVADLKWERVE